MDQISALKQHLQKSKIKGLALDIDETLSKTRDYFIGQIIKKFGNPEKLSVNKLIKKYRYTHNIPYWQNEEVEEFMESQLRRSAKVTESLKLIPNSAKAVNTINKTIPIAAYITARPLSVQKATKQWLKINNFPEAPLITRPNSVLHKNIHKWKAGVLKKLYPNIIGIVDDNQKLIEFLPADYKGTIYLFDTIACPAPPKIKVLCCKDWNEVLKNIIISKS
jgi:uncharacterized HAD superfamily protein